jgi:1,2-dihydroxy-3-keto-5-methylthiopentene dioxygenase
MSSLSVYPVSSPDLPNKVLTHFDDIASTLAELGVRFERCSTTLGVRAGTSPTEVIELYQAQIDQLKNERGGQAFDVLSLAEDHPQKAELRAGLLDEHRLDGDLACLFVAGRALFYVHSGDYVYAVRCEKHDLISLPAGTAHWLDLGEQPQLVAIRLFGNPKGWVAQFTGDAIASQFEPLDD